MVIENERRKMNNYKTWKWFITGIGVVTGLYYTRKPVCLLALLIPSLI